MKLKCVIIDDEPEAVRLLAKILTDFYPGKTDIAGTASNTVEGVKLINKTNPDLVFLDVEMPNASGFDLIEMQPGFTFKVVFVTAYDKHAVRAIRYKPDGYLLKPIDIMELVNVVNAIHKTSQEKAQHARFSMGKYSIAVKDEIILVDFAEIQFIKASGRYSDVYLTGSRVVEVCKNIGHFEKELLAEGFVRCHKSYLVNPKHILKLNKIDGGFIEMSNGTAIEISRRKRNVFFRHAG